MREDWLDGPEDTGDVPPRRRPRWFPALIAVPWVVVAGLLVAPSLGRENHDGGMVASDVVEPGVDAGTVAEEAASGGPSADEVAAGGASTGTPGDLTSASSPDATPTTSAPVTEVVEIQEYRGAWRVAPGTEEAASLALVVARAWLTGIGPILTLGDLDPVAADAYAEHLVVEASERTSPDTEVVTVLAVTLRDVDSGTPTVGVERLAVPIAWQEDGPRPAGAPWPLPGPDLRPLTPTLSPIEADGDAWDQVTAALAEAGLGTHRLEALRAAADGPVVATVTDDVDRHDVWLRPHLGGYVVAGSTLRGAIGSEADGEVRP